VVASSKALRGRYTGEMKRFIGALLCLVGAGCDLKLVPVPDRTEPESFEGKGFTATLRRDVLHNAETPTNGVTLYDFHVGSMPLLFMYSGDTAGYPHFGWAADREASEKLPSGLPAHCRYSEKGEGKARECLITLSKHSPKQLLVFYEKLPAKWSKVADEIIASVEPRDE
jgi:hypothetical protein